MNLQAILDRSSGDIILMDSGFDRLNFKVCFRDALAPRLSTGLTAPISEANFLRIAVLAAVPESPPFCGKFVVLLRALRSLRSCSFKRMTDKLLAE